MKKPLTVRVGSVVAFNSLPDAVWFDVLEIRGFDMTIRETGTQNKEQHMDSSLVEQVRNE